VRILGNRHRAIAVPVDRSGLRDVMSN